jgi:hypothetical protein
MILLDELKMNQKDVAEYISARQKVSPKELFLTTKTFSDALKTVTERSDEIHEIDGKLCISAKSIKLIFSLGVTKDNPLHIYIK